MCVFKIFISRLSNMLYMRQCSCVCVCAYIFQHFLFLFGDIKLHLININIYIMPDNTNHAFITS